MRETASPSLSERTTLRLGGKALAELVLERREDLDALPGRLLAIGGKPVWLGRGSNILALSGELPISLVRVAFAWGPEVLGVKNGKVLVKVPAGLPMPALLNFCLKKGLAGLEGLAGIPGTAGGAVAMNAGSFGTSTANFLHSLTAVAGSSLKTYKINELRPEYRRLAFPGQSENPLVIEIIFALTEAPKGVIFKLTRQNFLKKKSRQPLSAWSAGCAFKNPVSGPTAGELLDALGFRGMSRGGMAFSEKHANFLVNEGKGEPEAAIDLLRTARDRASERFGVWLEPEIRMLPCPSL